jgi:hypothetical protein
MDWSEDFVNAKYHLAVAERMLVSYGEVGDKRFLVGVIREAAQAVNFLIRSIGEDWRDVIAKCVDGVTCENLFKVLEIERAQRDSPIEYAKGEKIILLIDGKYRILTADRIREFVKSVGVAIKVFSGNFRQV